MGSHKWLLTASGITGVLLLLVAVNGGHIDHAVAQAIREVLVINTLAQPVPTIVRNAAATPVLSRDVDAPARQEPYNFSFTEGIPAGTQNGDALLAVVQNGQRLVIEHVSVGADVGLNDKATGIIMGLVGGQVAWQHALVFAAQGDFTVGDFARFAASHAMRIYVDGGTNVAVRVLRGDPSTGPAGFTASISGYRVNVP